MAAIVRNIFGVSPNDRQGLWIMYNNVTSPRGEHLKPLCAEGNGCLIVYK